MTFLELAKYWVDKRTKEHINSLTDKGNSPAVSAQRYLAAVELSRLILLYENPHNREDIRNELARIESDIKNGN